LQSQSADRYIPKVGVEKVQGHDHDMKSLVNRSPYSLSRAHLLGLKDAGLGNRQRKKGLFRSSRSAPVNMESGPKELRE
jgi:hypothetical protein